jgi:site-specific DNA-methyltransferase (adenine-specific)
MNVVEKRLDEITPYENNPRINDGAVDAVAESIKAYGWKVPIVVDSDGVIVTGHTRYKAARKLGLEKVPCVIASDLTPEQCRAFRIADNKTSDFSIWDNKLLLDELDGIGDLFTGFEPGDVFDIYDEGSSPLAGNAKGVTYELTLKSADRERLLRVRDMWEGGQL